MLGNPFWRGHLTKVIHSLVLVRRVQFRHAQFPLPIVKFAFTNWTLGILPGFVVADLRRNLTTLHLPKHSFTHTLLQRVVNLGRVIYHIARHGKLGLAFWRDKLLWRWVVACVLANLRPSNGLDRP